MRGVGLESELGGRLVEGLLDIAAVACCMCISLKLKSALEPLPNSPKHVLLPPVVRTHQSSGVVWPSETGPYRVSFQFSSVRMFSFMLPALASAAAMGSWRPGLGM